MNWRSPLFLAVLGATSAAITCIKSEFYFWDFPAGCECLDQWSEQDNTDSCYTGCANPDSDPSGAWCFLNSSCPGNVATQGDPYGYCSQSAQGLMISAVINEGKGNQAIELYAYQIVLDLSRYQLGAFPDSTSTTRRRLTAQQDFILPSGAAGQGEYLYVTAGPPSATFASAMATKGRVIDQNAGSWLLLDNVTSLGLSVDNVMYDRYGGTVTGNRASLAGALRVRKGGGRPTLNFNPEDWFMTLSGDPANLGTFSENFVNLISEAPTRSPTVNTVAPTFGPTFQPTAVPTIPPTFNKTLDLLKTSNPLGCGEINIGTFSPVNLLPNGGEEIRVTGCRLSEVRYFEIWPEDDPDAVELIFVNTSETVPGLTPKDHDLVIIYSLPSNVTEVYAIIRPKVTGDKQIEPKRLYYKPRTCNLEGEYKPNPAKTACEACPEGSYCPGGGGRAWPKAGWWSLSEYDIPQKCPGTEKACPGVPRTALDSQPTLTVEGNNTLLLRTDNCNPGYTGVLCRQCADNYYEPLPGSCLACGEFEQDDSDELVLALTVLVGIFSLITVCVMILSTKGLTDLVGYIIFIQQIAQIGKFTTLVMGPDLDWLVDFFSYVSIFNFEIGVIKDGCSTVPRIAYEAEYWGTLSFGLGMAVIWIIGSVAHVKIFRKACACCFEEEIELETPRHGHDKHYYDEHHPPPPPPKLPDAAPPAEDANGDEVVAVGAGAGEDQPTDLKRVMPAAEADLALEEEDARERKREADAKKSKVMGIVRQLTMGGKGGLDGLERSKTRVEILHDVQDDGVESLVKYRAIHSVLILGMIMHLKLTQMAFQALQCLDIDGVSYLEKDTTLVCFEGSHLPIAITSIFIFVFFSIGYPVCSFRLIQKGYVFFPGKGEDAVIKEARMLEALSFMYRDLKPRYRMFMSFEFMVNFVSVFIEYKAVDEMTRIFIMWACYNMSLLFMSTTLPYGEACDNIMNIVISAFSCMQTVAALAFVIFEFKSDKLDDKGNVLLGRSEANPSDQAMFYTSAALILVCVIALCTRLAHHFLFVRKRLKVAPGPDGDGPHKKSVD